MLDIFRSRLKRENASLKRRYAMAIQDIVDAHQKIKHLELKNKMFAEALDAVAPVGGLDEKREGTVTRDCTPGSRQEASKHSSD